jgi:hypothetical protein
MNSLAIPAQAGPIAPQAPEFVRFLWPCTLGMRHAGWDMDPGLRRDGVICSEAVMNANWIAPLDSRGQRPESVSLKPDML